MTSSACNMMINKMNFTDSNRSNRQSERTRVRTDVHDQSRQPTRRGNADLALLTTRRPRRFHSTSTNILAALASQPSTPAAVPRSRCLFRRVSSSTHARLLKKLQSDCLLLHSQGGCLRQATTLLNLSPWPRGRCGAYACSRAS
jgi:hypothetical protein